VKKKRTGREACNINKQTIYIAPKWKVESRAHYAQEPDWGSALSSKCKQCHVPSQRRRLNTDLFRYK